MDREYEKIARLNETLVNLQELRKIRDEETQNKNYDMQDINGNQLFQIYGYMTESHVRRGSTVIEHGLNVSPQEVLIGYMEGSEIYRDLVKQLAEDMKYADALSVLGEFVTPNVNKGVWIRECHLKEKSVQGYIFEMTLNDMVQMLKNCADPEINLARGVYTVSTPEAFVETINQHEMYMFDFVPYVKNKSIIDRNSLYHLTGRIMLSSDCQETETVTDGRFLQTIDVQDIRSLDPGEMVTNVIIDFYLNHVLKRHAKERRIKVWSTDMYSLLFNSARNNTEAKIVHEYSGVNGERLKGVKKSRYKALIIPILVQGSHWLLSIIDFENNQLFVLNSMKWRKCENDGDRYYDHRIIRNMQLLMETDELEAESWTFSLLPVRDNQIPCQTNAVDCGIFCIKFAEHYIREENLDFDFLNTNTEMNNFRKTIQQLVVREQKKSQIKKKI